MSTEIEQFGQRYCACYVCRRPYGDTIEDLSFKDELPAAFQHHDVRPKSDSDLAVTLVERGEVQHAREFHKAIGHLAARDLVPKILKPDSATAASPLELKVIGVRYLGRRISSKRCVALMLDDSDGVLEEERELYTKRLSKEIHWKPTNPHITIAKLEPFNAIDDILDWVELRCPPFISVQPVTATKIAPLHKSVVID